LNSRKKTISKFKADGLKKKFQKERQLALVHAEGNECEIDNVKFPKYYLDEVLQIWKEDSPPEPALFYSIGFNDQSKIEQLQFIMDEN